MIEIIKIKQLVPGGDEAVRVLLEELKNFPKGEWIKSFNNVAYQILEIRENTLDIKESVVVLRLMKENKTYPYAINIHVNHFKQSRYFINE